MQLWDFKFKYNKNALYQTVYKFGKQFRYESNCEYCIFSGGSKPSNEGGPCQPDPWIRRWGAVLKRSFRPFGALVSSKNKGGGARPPGPPSPGSATDF